MTSSKAVNSPFAIFTPYLKLSQRLGLGGLSGVLTALPFMHSKLFLCAWFAYIPLLVAIKGVSLRQSYGVGVAAGIGFQVTATYWIISFITQIKGYDLGVSFALALIYWLLSAQMMGIVTLMCSWLTTRNSSGLLLRFPVVVVAVYSVFPMLFPAQPGEGQAYFLTAIQATEFTGVFGLDFVIVLVNVLLFFLLIDRHIVLPRLSLLTAVTIPVIWFGYGMFSLSDWDHRIDGWTTKRIGLVQSNEVPSIDIPLPTKGYGWSYPPEMELTHRLVAEGVEFILWPETRYKGYFSNRYIQAAYKSHINTLNVPLLFHDMESVSVEEKSNEGDVQHTIKEFNTVILMTRDGKAADFYRKMKRIPFGEYVPLFEENVTARRLAEKVLGPFVAKLSAGNQHKEFAVAGMRIIPSICYEIVFPRFISEAVPDDAKGAVLANVSFDGWFGDSRQPYQHVSISILRAVENRLPLIHLLNNGPSVVVMPTGKIIATTEPFVQAAVVVDMPYSKDYGGSFFSRYPWAFLIVVYVMLGYCIISTLKKGVDKKP